MPTFDATITFSLVLAVCAVISPVLTTLMNNHHQMKLKKLELKQQHYRETVLYKRAIFENYIKHASRCATFANTEELRNYSEYYLIALMYAPAAIRSDMMNIHQLMISSEWEDAGPCLNELAPKIADLIEKM